MRANTDTHYDKANNPEEVLDLVDENDVVIGKVDRPKANTDPQYIHREISVLLFDDDMRIVMQKRSQYKSVHPNMWSMVAGHIPAGGDPEQAAYIELEEEFGLTGIPLHYLTKKYLEYPHESHFMYYYIGRYSGQKISFEEVGVSEVKVVSQDELTELIKSGESFNTKYLPILEDIWAGKYTL